MLDDTELDTDAIPPDDVEPVEDDTDPNAEEPEPTEKDPEDDASTAPIDPTVNNG